MAGELPEQLYEKAVADLQTAYDELFQVTNNQQGMPDYLRGVASQFGEVKELVGKLEEYALKSATSWEKQLSGNNNNNYNSNATMAVNGGRRRKSRKSRKSRKTRKPRRKN